MSKRRPGSKLYRALNQKRWSAVRERVLRRDGRRCQKCGAASRLEIHHVRSLQDGGDPYALDNCVAWCRFCHIAHHNPPQAPAWQAASRLGAAVNRAVDTLESLLNSDKEMVQLSAARSIIQAAMSYRETVDVEERIAALETQIEMQRRM